MPTPYSSSSLVFQFSFHQVIARILRFVSRSNPTWNLGSVSSLNMLKPERERESMVKVLSQSALIRNMSNPAKLQRISSLILPPSSSRVRFALDRGTPVLLQLRYSSRRMPNPRNLTELFIMIDSIPDSVRAKNDLANAIIPIFRHDATQLWKFM